VRQYSLSSAFKTVVTYITNEAFEHQFVWLNGLVVSALGIRAR